MDKLSGKAVGAFNYSAHAVSLGAAWLDERGYTNIKGGDEASYWNTHGKNVTSRTYVATDTEGQRVEKTVSFGLLGPHSPLFDS